MPSGKNWLYFLYVNLGFIIYIAACYYLTSVKEIKDNWPLYRCNPMYMPLSDNMNEDFTYCVQNITTSSMGYLLQPLTFITSTLSTMGSSFTTEINNVREMFNKVRTFMSTIFQTIFGVFLNIIIEFEKMIIGLKDMVGKTIGMMVTLLYVLDGSLKTMQSAWNGPNGQLVRSLGKCFHPDTKLLLQNGKEVAMKDIHLGDVLSNGSIVYATMQIDNVDRNTLLKKEPLYEIKNTGLHGESIFVTGSHLIQVKREKEEGKKEEGKKENFIAVKDYSLAHKTDKTTDYFSCLITSNHRITIGKEVFWDWEDHFVN